MSRLLIAVLFGLLIPVFLSCPESGGKPRGGAFFPLKTAGIAYTAPAGWEVVDPPLNEDQIHSRKGRKGHIGFSLIHVQKNIAVAVFYPDDRSLVCVACQGPHRPDNGSDPKPLVHVTGYEWEHYWWNENLPLVYNRREGTVLLADGTPLAYRQAGMKPGVLAGEDVVHAIAYGKVKGRYLAIGGGMTRTDMDTDNRLEAHMRRMAASLSLQGDSAPSPLRDPI
jgi:hypothetical protein